MNTGLSPTLLLSAVGQRATATVLAACTTLIVYDYILTLRQEIIHVWRSPVSVGKVLFFLVRYFAFIDLSLLDWHYFAVTSSSPSCKITQTILMCFQLVGILGSCAVVGLRTWAIWNRNRLCAVVLLSAFLCSVGWGVADVVVFTAALSEYGSPLVPMAGCLWETSSEALLLMHEFYIVLAVYEAIILLGTLLRGFEHLRKQPGLLVTVLYRDAFLASCLLSVTSVIAAYMFETNNAEVFAYAFFHRTMTAVVSTRIMLNIREVSTSANRGNVTSESVETTVLTSGVANSTAANGMSLGLRESSW